MDITPDEVKRDGCAGVPVTLADQEWLIPIARQAPMAFAVDAAGVPRQTNPAGNANYLAMALRAFEQLLQTEDDAPVVELPGGWELCCTALATNYNVDPRTISDLGLIDDQALLAIALIAADLHETKPAEARAGSIPFQRMAQYQAWRYRIAPGYCPSCLDLFLLSQARSSF